MPRQIFLAIVVAVFLAVVPAAVFSLGSGSGVGAAFQRAWARLRSHAPEPREGDTLLAIRFDAQDHALSCEAAALKMALAYRGVGVDERDILAAIGNDPTPKTRQSDGVTVWGDPQRGFVGNVDGRMLVDGYGVHWNPVARAAGRWRRAQAFQGWDARRLAGELAAGNPIVVWGYLGSGKPYVWQTPAGAAVHAVEREHTFTAYGFRGMIDSPEGFYLMDPVYGAKYVAADDFMQNWRALGYSGVVIY